MSAAFVLFLNGTYGVGKSTVLDHVGDVLAEAGRPFSLLDVDWFHRSWPPAADDPDNVRTEAANLAAVWRGYRATGPRQPVLAGVLASPADRDRYEEVFSLPVRSVRLTASVATVRARLTARYGDARPGPLAWHLERFEALARQQARADLDELVLGTGAIPPRPLAEQVCRHV